MGYTKHTLKGVSWMSGLRFATRTLSFLKTLILARLLSPSDFGLFGIAMLVLSFLDMLTETGIEVFLIQLKTRFEDYIETAWIVSIGRGAIIGLCIAVASPFIASFFKTPQATSILLFSSLVPFIQGFANPAEIRLQKDLRFHLEFWFRFAIFAFDACVGIIFIIATHSVYGLIWGLVAGAILEVVLSFILISPKPTGKFKSSQIKEMFHVGRWVTIFGIANYVAQEGDNVAVGRSLGSNSLGIYDMAYNISTLPISEVTDVVSKVTFPIFTKIEGDRKRLQKAFVKVTLTITAITLTIGLILFLFPKEIVLLLLGKNWLPVITVLPILSFYGVLRAIFGSASSLFLAVQKQQYVAYMTIARSIALGVTIFPFIHVFGIIGAGMSALFSVLVEIPLIVYYIFLVFKRK